MTAVIPEASTATPPPEGGDISTIPTALDSEPAPVSWQQLRAMTDSYRGVTTPLAEVGIGVSKLVRRNGGSDLKLACTLFQQFVIRPVNEHASDEAEGEAIA